MAITKEVCNDEITVTKYGDLEIRECTKFFEDGVEKSYSYKRRVISSGSNVSNESQRIQDLYAAAQLNKMERPPTEI